MDPKAEIERYRQQRSTLVSFTDKMQRVLQDILAHTNVPIQSIESRTKTVDSFAEKIQRAGKSYQNPLAQLTDLCGLRIITYYADDVDVVVDALRRSFTIDEQNSVDKRASLNPSEFGYQSVHLIVRLDDTRASLPEWGGCSTFKVEVQVRSVLQHAWAAIEHSLQYKASIEAPLQLRRSLTRLAGLLELADAEFERLRDHQRRERDVAKQAVESGNALIPLNIETLGQYIESSALALRVQEAAVSAGFSVRAGPKAPDYQRRFVALATDLALHAGCITIVDWQESVHEALNWAEDYFRCILEARDAEHQTRGWWGDAHFFVALLSIALYPPVVSAENLVDRGWSDQVAELVVKATTRFLGRSDDT